MRQRDVSRDEFAAFYAENKDRCLRAAMANGMPHPEAEDAVAEAFARAWASWRSVRKSRSPAAWVVRTAINSNISQWRKRRREVFDGDPAGRRAGEPTTVGPEPRDELMSALHRLPPRQREVVILRYLLDQDAATTASWMGISTGTVGAHLHHALNALHAMLAEPNGVPT